MAKTTKKKNRKLRRQIRKTVGALFMASAIVVAAIPVQDVRGADPNPAGTTKKIKVLNYTTADMDKYETNYNDSRADLSSIEPYLYSGVPYVAKNATIYTTGDGMFQFAFVKPSSTASDEVAVILGAVINSLPGNKLTIPANVDAYKKYTANTTSDGYCAVNRKGEYLYYKAEAQKLDPDTKSPLYAVPGLKDSTDPADPGEITAYHPAMHATTQNDDGTWNYVYRVETGKDDEGNAVYTDYPTVSLTTDTMFPCYYDTRTEWIEKPDSELYYWNSTTDPVNFTAVDKFAAATTSQYQRIYDAQVQYIGRQYLEPNTKGGNSQTGAGASEWVVGEEITENNPEKGVFAGKGQIAYLTIETVETSEGPKGNLLGIGDYAFYGCTGLHEVKLENGLNTIGNGAFQNCTNMTQITMNEFSQLTAIGKRAFSHCEALSSIKLPINVRAIGDYCFEGCYNAGTNQGLQTIDINGGGKYNSLLQAIGYKAFSGCANLISVTFPSGYTDFEKRTAPDSTETRPVTGIPITYFEGCTALQYVKVQNSEFTFIESNHTSYPGCDIGSFLKNTVSDSFYFEGPKGSSIHKTAKLHSAAYKYVEKDEAGNPVDRYERVVWCPETEYNDDGSVKPNTGHECTFTVDTNNELVAMEIPRECGVVEIPANLGAGHGIERIGSDSFQNNMELIKITIPSTVKYIDEGAFRGCKNLQAAIFSEPINIEDIGEEAFKTGSEYLSFTGEISPDSKPFAYAMDYRNNINARNQPLTYITFYSGWPTNLTVQYTPDDVEKPEIGENELIDYPRYEDLKNAKYIAWNKKNKPAEGEIFDKEDNRIEGKITYPYVTEEEATIANGAVTAGESATPDQIAIVNSALKLDLPAGITSIKDGIFSDIAFEKDNGKIKYDEDGNPILQVDADGNLVKPKLDTDGKPVLDANGKPMEEPLDGYKNEHIQSITMHTVKTVDPYTFAGCEKLSGFYMKGGDEVGNYAFKGCKALENVEVAASVSELGLRPFAGCSKLKTVNFAGGPNYSCENAIIYGLNNGVKDTIVECLESRSSTEQGGSYTVGPEELQGVTNIYQEAFMDCGNIGRVDLSTTSVNTVPEKCFKNTTDITSVILPDTVKTIRSESFKNSNIRQLTIPGNQTNIAEDAFMKGDWVKKSSDREKDPGGTGQHNIDFECVKGTTADEYAQYYWYLRPVYDKVYLQHTVTFWDYPNYPDTSEQAVYYVTKVKDGEAAVPPEMPPVHDGVAFSRWTNYQNIVKDTDVYPVFGDDVFTVQFLDDDGTALSEVQYIEAGKSATPPADPVKEGATFKGWSKPYYNIMEDTLCIAQYDYGTESNLHTVTFYSHDGTKVIAEMKVLHGGTVYPPSAPARDGYTFIGWVPAGGFSNITSDKNFTASYDRTSKDGDKDDDDDDDKKKDSSASPSASPTASPSVTKYTVSVSGGSGSGSYAAGDIVPLNAYFMGEGQSFDKWTTSTAGVGFANPSASSTTFTMPAANVAITATYKTGSGTTATGGGSTAGGGGTGAAPANTGSGTTVQVSKPGISNTGLAGATVSGATDNFIVKVTEQQAATDAAVAALQARYGSLDRIKYFPMDISLYDSTGRTKIADTSGISVNITLPLPDDQVQYAGNNRIAAIANGSLEDLNAKFTTVDGVPCINFTASHFSPYVIYVDTANLTAGTIDSTPKTGDPIHPKWFLAIGMACISLILFFKKDKAVVRPGRA